MFFHEYTKVLRIIQLIEGESGYNGRYTSTHKRLPVNDEIVLVRAKTGGSYLSTTTEVHTKNEKGKQSNVLRQMIDVISLCHCQRKERRHKPQTNRLLWPAWLSAPIFGTLLLRPDTARLSEYMPKIMFFT